MSDAVKEAIAKGGGVVLTTQSDTEKHSETQCVGNTITTHTNTTKKAKKCRNWFFTWNNPTMALKTLMDNTDAMEWVGQAEMGQEGTLHLQFCARWKNARSFNQIKDKLPDGVHIEQSRNWWNSVKYCTKESSRVAGPWASHRDLIVQKKEVSWEAGSMDLELNEWQKNLYEELMTKAPDKRKIMWLVDPEGGAGKSEFATWMRRNVKRVHKVTGAEADGMYMLASALTNADKEKNGNFRVDIVFFDIPRSGKVSYTMLERVKNGEIASTKYESTIIDVSRPHVVVLANWPPVKSKLSEDKWDIRYISRVDETNTEEQFSVNTSLDCSPEGVTRDT